MNTAVLVSLLALSSSALAQPGAFAASAPVPAHAEPPPSAAGAQRSEHVALGLSLGGTVVSWSLLVAASQVEDSDTAQLMSTFGAAGAMFAPALGHGYAAGTVATRGLGLRALGLGSAVVGAAVSLSACPILASGDECSESVAGQGLLLLGAGLFLGGTLDDIITAPGRARAHNAAITSVAVVPTVQRDGGGLAVAGSF